MLTNCLSLQQGLLRRKRHDGRIAADFPSAGLGIDAAFDTPAFGVNLLLFESAELQGGYLDVHGPRAEHLSGICKLQPGDPVRVGEIGGGCGEARVEQITKEYVRLLVPNMKGAPPTPWIDLILAIPRPIMLKRIIQLCGTVAIRRLMLISSARVEKSFFQSPLLEESGIREQLLLGMEQGMSTYLPAVTIHRSFRRFLAEQFTAAPGSLCLLAHPQAEVNVLRALSSGPRQVTVAIGPEGGWIPSEVEDFAARGFAKISLGARTLRVENAVNFALAQLELAREEFAGEA
jgi:16S rRNA (uracil1498-N3)-methyltransferase